MEMHGDSDDPLEILESATGGEEDDLLEKFFIADVAIWGGKTYTGCLRCGWSRKISVVKAIGHLLGDYKKEVKACQPLQNATTPELTTDVRKQLRELREERQKNSTQNRGQRANEKKNENTTLGSACVG